MGRVIPVIVLVALTIYCTIEVVQASPYEVRRMPKWLWAVVVIGVPLFGPVAWLLFGRPTSGNGHHLGPPGAPDDDPDFLRRL